MSALGRHRHSMAKPLRQQPAEVVWKQPTTRNSEHRWFSKADSWSLTVVGFFPSRGGVGSALMDLPRSVGVAIGGYAPSSRIARMVSWKPRMLITRLRL